MCLFQTRLNLAAALQKTKWPSSNVTSAGKASCSQSKVSSLATHVPTDFSPLFLYRALILILLVLLFVFSTKPCHLGTLVSQCDRERGLCPRVREQGSNSWLQTINHDLGCTLLIKCFRSVPHFKRSKDLSNRVMTDKWTDGCKALSIMPASYEDSGTHQTGSPALTSASSTPRIQRYTSKYNKHTFLRA